MNQEYDPTIQIPFKNYNMRQFHDRLNQAQNFLKYVREMQLKKDDVVKAYGLKNKHFDYSNSKGVLEKLEA